MGQEVQADDPNAIHFSIDSGGKILDVDESIEELIGYKKEELVGQDFRLFIHPQDEPGLFVSFQKTLDGMLESYEYRIKTKSGGHVLVRSFSHPTKQEGVTTGIEGTLVKI